jgi:hypothetical protein
MIEVILDSNELKEKLGLRNGLDGKDGKTPVAGVDFPIPQDGLSIEGPKGEDGSDGRDGSPDSPSEIVTKLESLEGEDRLDLSAIRGLEDYDAVAKLAKEPKTVTNIVQAGGGSSGGGTPSLTSTYIGFGSATNGLTGTSNATLDASGNADFAGTMAIGSADGTYGFDSRTSGARLTGWKSFDGVSGEIVIDGTGEVTISSASDSTVYDKALNIQGFPVNISGYAVQITASNYTIDGNGSAYFAGYLGVGTTAGAGAEGSSFRIAGDNGVVGGGQAIFTGASNTDMQLIFGYNTDGDYGQIQAVHQMVSLTPLVLNPAGGAVGIGATAPSDSLTVSNAGGTNGWIGIKPSSGPAYMYEQIPDSSQYAQIAHLDEAGTYRSYFGYIGTTYADAARAGTVELGSNGTDITIRPNEIEAVRITQSGYFGLGIVPTARFEMQNLDYGIAQTIRATDGSKIFEMLDGGELAYGGDALSGAFDPNWQCNANRSIHFAKFTNFDMSGRTIMGVGMNDGAGGGATFDLRAHGTGYSETLFDVDMVNKCAMIAQGGEDFVIGNYAAYPLRFGTNNTTQAMIDGSGNFGIGVIPSGSYKLEVNGNVLADRNGYTFTDSNNDVWQVGDPDANEGYYIQASGYQVLSLSAGGSMYVADSVSSPFLVGESTQDATSLFTGAVRSLGGISAQKAIAGLKFDAIGGTITAPSPMYRATQTWNSAGSTFNANLIDITDTASNAASTFVEYRTAGTPRFSVRKDGTVNSSGDIKANVVGKGIYVKEGTNATMGVATLVAGVVVVSTTKVTANSRIFLTRQTTAGTLGTSVDVTARTAGTSFTITSNGSILDTSTVAWMIVEPA